MWLIYLNVEKNISLSGVEAFERNLRLMKWIDQFIFKPIDIFVSIYAFFMFFLSDSVIHLTFNTSSIIVFVHVAVVTDFTFGTLQLLNTFTHFPKIILVTFTLFFVLC
jgi:hypothetical protein